MDFDNKNLYVYVSVAHDDDIVVKITEELSFL